MSRDTLSVHVRNVLGIVKADLTLNGVTLVGGVNAAGKSSLLEAVGACALADPAFRGLRNKTEQARALHDGAEVGSVLIEYQNGKVRLLLPAGETEQIGRPVFLGSALGIGRTRFMALDAKERAREFFERCKAAPVKDDLKAWFRGHPGSGLEHDDKAETLDHLWTSIEESGWDAITKGVATYGTKRKGAWEQVTKAKFGAAKSASWAPAALDRAGDLDEEALAERLVTLRTAVAELQIAAAASKINASQLRKDIDAAAGVAERLARSAAERETVQQRLEDATRARQNLQMPGEQTRARVLPCPHCGNDVEIKDSGGGAMLLVRPAPAPHASRASELRKQAADLDQKIHVYQSSMTGFAAEDVKMRNVLALAERARERLAEAEAGAAAFDADALAEKERSAVACQEQIALIGQRDQARAIYDDWLRNQVLLEALQPEGVRRTVLQRRLSAINVSIAAITAAAGMRQVELTDDLEARYDSRPYGLCSESERWRVDFVLAVLFHTLEDATFLLLDRLDLLVPQDRGPMILALKRLKVTALVAMSAKDRAAVPDLAAAKAGTAVWVEQGTVGPCK